jgi:cell division protease FtsH
VLQEARALLEHAQAKCARLLMSNRGRLDALAQALLERDVLAGDDLKALLGGHTSIEAVPA